MTALLVALQPVAARSLEAQEQTTGILTAVWGDPAAGSADSPALRWFLSDDRGRTLAVDVPAAVLGRAGGVRSLDRRRVEVAGALTRAPGARPGDRGLLRATHVRVVGEAPGAGVGTGSLAQTGDRPYAVLLCRFADLASEPRPASFFESLMGGGYPNLDHYYREISGGRMTLAGTRALGWFDLPHPHAAYFEADGSLALYRLADDCIAAAGAADFSRFTGIIVQVNGPLSLSGGGLAWGGSRVLALDGGERVWPFVWMPAWATEDSRYGIYAHELGHSLGLPHSSGPYAATYDSSWDVMSRPYLRWEPAVQAWVPGQTIAFHKHLLGWLPAGRVITLGPASDREIRLDPHSVAGGGDPVLVRLPIPGTPDFYTVEARRRTGYDQGLPDDAVIIHRVPDPLGPDCTPHRCARVVDPSGNGNPNDAGAIWRPGETFEEGAVRVTVTGATATGWTLAVSLDAPARPAGLTVERAAHALFRDGELTAAEAAYLDAMGNRNGRYDLGDFLSLVRREEDR